VATKYIKGYGIRIAFGCAVIGCAISIVLKLAPSFLPQYKVAFDNAATFFVLGVVAALSTYIAVKMVQGAKAEVAGKKRAAMARAA
jgi:hypothetical protein